MVRNIFYTVQLELIFLILFGGTLGVLHVIKTHMSQATNGNIFHV